MLYLIAKAERKEKTFSSQHEIIFCQKEKGRKMFLVKAISKDVRKKIVPSLMFLFSLSKSVVLCVKKCKYNRIFTTELIKQQINTHDFLVRSLCYIKTKDEKRCLRRAICGTP